MLVGYIGPGAAGSDGEILHHFIGELLDDCEVYVIVPDIDGDKSYFDVRKKMPSGEIREVNLQGWDIESIIDILKEEKESYANDIMERVVRKENIDFEKSKEVFSLMMELEDRLVKAYREVSEETWKRYDKIMEERRKVEDGKDEKAGEAHN